MVALALVISLVFLGRIEGVREGTLISAVMIGWFARYVGRFLGPRLALVLNPKVDEKTVMEAEMEM